MIWGFRGWSVELRLCRYRLKVCGRAARVGLTLLFLEHLLLSPIFLKRHATHESRLFCIRRPLGRLPGRLRLDIHRGIEAWEIKRRLGVGRRDARYWGEGRGLEGRAGGLGTAVRVVGGILGERRLRLRGRVVPGRSPLIRIGRGGVGGAASMETEVR